MLLRGQPTKKAGKVLIVNSDPEIIKILELNLCYANLEVISAQTGAEALRKLSDEQTDIIILDPSFPDIDGDEICRQINELPHTRNTPVIFVSTRIPKNSNIQLDEANNYFITKPFNPEEIVTLVQGYLTQKERLSNVNPLTGLPNRVQFDREISRLLQRNAVFAALFIITHDIKAINRTYGYSQGDQVIQLLADIVSETVRLFGNPEDLAGYFGGDKFVVISTPWKAKTLCRRIIADFNRRIKALYADEHLQAGYIPDNSPIESKEETPIMSIHIATVTNQKRSFNHPFEVAEAAFEQIEYLRCSPESNCYFDLQVNGVAPSMISTYKEILYAQKKELNTIKGVLSWFDFLLSELNKPINLIDDSIQFLESQNAAGPGLEQPERIAELRRNYLQLKRVVEGINNLAMPNELATDDLFNEVDISAILTRITEMVSLPADSKNINIDIQATGKIGRMMGDKKSITQALLYILRSEVQSSPNGSVLSLRLFQKNDDFLGLEIVNPNHYIAPKQLNSLIQGYFFDSDESYMNELFAAKVILRGLGGNLEIISEKGHGTFYKISIPQKWPSWMKELDTLQLATDISRKEARDTLKNIERLISSPVGQTPPAVNENFGKLSSKVQELGVLCNRSQFLADDLSNRLEAQQDLLLQQEIQQISTIEAILVLCREMAKTLNAENLFELDSAKRVVKYALAIASELKASDSDRQTLHYAALCKDIAVAFSPENLETSVPAGISIKERVSLVWKALSTIPFFSKACDLVQFRHERYDGVGRRFGVKGCDIPLGARILAVADTIELLASGRSPLGNMSAKQVLETVVNESGQCFDPQVVDALVALWKRKQLELA